jgi:hypothetical protein
MAAHRKLDQRAVYFISPRSGGTPVALRPVRELTGPAPKKFTEFLPVRNGVETIVC